MIEIKLKALAEKLGKSITDIAADTGLNRNTITALYHNKVDGIKFDTIEKICGVYNVPLESLVSMSVVSPLQTKPAKITFDYPYKQDGDLNMFTVVFGGLISKQMPEEFFDTQLGELMAFFKKDYGILYWQKDKMNLAADAFVKKYKTEKELNRLFNAFSEHAGNIEDLYRARSLEEILGYSEEKIISFTKEVFETYRGFWQTSLFIDIFDAGFDVMKIEEYKKTYNLKDEEVVMLTTPEMMTFNNDRHLALLEITKKIKISKKLTKEAVKKELSRSIPVKQYIVDFDYYKSNYSFIHHITLDDVVEDVVNLLKENKWQVEYKKLSSYSKVQKKKIEEVLEKKKLRSNPLFLFQKLVYWRERRKQVNLMGIHLLHYILLSIEAKTGIPYKFLKQLAYDEVPNVFKGLVNRAQLEKRYNEGVLYYPTSSTEYKIVVGKEAQSISDELEEKIRGGGKDQKIITGRVACQGYAKGIARIILTLDDFSKFKEGEILVTGMTRPEFVPLMKKAAAIVTNEGGVTCHAAIVSRELGKPCIIGTQKATQLIKDGDLIEVRANHGTVRILN